MKKLLSILAFFITINAFSQSSDAVANALKEADAAKFTSYFSSSVDIKLPQQSEMKGLSRSNAAGIIQSFFEKNQISSCELFLPARELNGMTYVAGKLKGAKQSYNITVVLKNTGNDMTVITVRIL